MTSPGKVHFEKKFTKMTSRKVSGAKVGAGNREMIAHKDHFFEVSVPFYKKALRKKRTLVCNVCGGAVRIGNR